MTWRRHLYRPYARLERLLVPEARFAHVIYEERLEFLSRDTSWLDLGCGWHLLPEWRSAAAEAALVDRARGVVGIDPDRKALRTHRTLGCVVQADGGRLPFRDGAFGLVTANMVVEHLPDPPAVFSEVRRVLEPGGHFVFHTPNSTGYHTLMADKVPGWLKAPLARLLEGRSAEDVYPVHYRANTVEEIASTAHQSGLDVQEITPALTPAESAVCLPLALVELLWMRRLSSPLHAHRRPNLIVTLRRPRRAPIPPRRSRGHRDSSMPEM